jgi:hypothetical protein
MRLWNFFSLPNSSSFTMALGLTQPLTERSTRKCLWGVERGQCIKLTTSLPSVNQLSRQCDPQDLTTQQASAVCYGDDFTFLLYRRKISLKCFVIKGKKVKPFL